MLLNVYKAVPFTTEDNRKPYFPILPVLLFIPFLLSGLRIESRANISHPSIYHWAASPVLSWLFILRSGLHQLLSLVLNSLCHPSRYKLPASSSFPNSQVCRSPPRPIQIFCCLPTRTFGSILRTSEMTCLHSTSYVRPTWSCASEWVHSKAFISPAWLLSAWLLKVEIISSYWHLDSWESKEKHARKKKVWCMAEKKTRVKI